MPFCSIATATAWLPETCVSDGSSWIVARDDVSRAPLIASRMEPSVVTTAARTRPPKGVSLSRSSLFSATVNPSAELNQPDGTCRRMSCDAVEPDDEDADLLLPPLDEWT